MRITDNRDIRKTFDELKAGEVFEVDNGIVCMKIEDISGEAKGILRLDTGEVQAYRSDCNVVPLDAELVIRSVRREP